MATAESERAPRPLSQPHVDRMPADPAYQAEIIKAHDGALAAGSAGYLDPRTGLFVLSAGFLAARGTCCGRGCRHCPYVK
ncbi:hypothetical protein Ais01nite_49890 [Asanoa ishikariensis]|uniref:Uncharacterized protein n=2 Tax=Asanoa ishikariensis TaxID=137265 RepID=A0A1H3RSJ7_9ACTN|nr:hypothetical protein Ais01nite_49890 [Asanoa ishikariensis]SDZ27849.1 hypothetical protein SAMN05421684_4093 [Asanoa ishikariensis]